MLQGVDLGRTAAVLVAVAVVVALVAAFFYFFPADHFWSGPNASDIGEGKRDPQYSNSIESFGRLAPIVLLIGLLMLLTMPIWRPLVWSAGVVRRAVGYDKVPGAKQ